jgi:predicted ester cyclase
MMRNAYPDFHATIEHVVAEGDKVAVRASFTGTHKGKLPGIPPTGKDMTWTCTTISRCASGKIVEEVADGNMLGFLQQLGVVPSLGY